jgi:hypothetical protein
MSLSSKVTETTSTSFVSPNAVATIEFVFLRGKSAWPPQRCGAGAERAQGRTMTSSLDFFVGAIIALARGAVN